jgi:hypothetical protein
MRDFRLDDAPKGACNGQTDNPNSDLNVTFWSMPNTTPSQTKVADRNGAKAAMPLPCCFQTHREAASGPAFWRASTKPVKSTRRKTSLGLYSTSHFNISSLRTGPRAEA